MASSSDRMPKNLLEVLRECLLVKMWRGDVVQMEWLMELPLVCMVSTHTSCLKPIPTSLLQLLEVQQTYCCKFLLSSNADGFAGTACSLEFWGSHRYLSNCKHTLFEPFRERRIGSTWIKTQRTSIWLAGKTHTWLCNQGDDCHAVWRTISRARHVDLVSMKYI